MLRSSLVFGAFALAALGCLLGIAFALRRRGVRWGLLGWGAIAFVGAQVVHVPVLLVLTLAFKAAPKAVPADIKLAINMFILGGTAGLFEELARYVVFKTAAKDARRWIEAVGVGFGHGGLEAALVLVLGLIQFVVLSVTPSSTLAPAGPEKVAQIAELLARFREAPASLALLSIWERADALILHVCCALLVWRSVRKNAWGWLVLAIAWHSAIDALAVYAAARQWTSLHVEFAVTVMMIPSLAWILITHRASSKSPEVLVS